MEAEVDGHPVLLGNLKLLQERDIRLDGLQERAVEMAGEGKTPMYVAVDGRAAGLIAVADTVKADSRDAIQTLKTMGLEVVMLTGDNRR